MYISRIVSVKRGAKDVPTDRQVTNVPETKGFPNSYIIRQFGIKKCPKKIGNLAIIL